MLTLPVLVVAPRSPRGPGFQVCGQAHQGFGVLSVVLTTWLAYEMVRTGLWVTRRGGNDASCECASRAISLAVVAACWTARRGIAVGIVVVLGDRLDLSIAG